MATTRNNVVALATRRAAKPAPAAAAPASVKAPRTARAPRAVAYSMAILPGLGEFDAPVSLGTVTISQWHDGAEVALALVGGTLALLTGNTKPNMRAVGSIDAKRGLYGATISFGKDVFSVVFGPAHVVAEHIAKPAVAPAPAPAAIDKGAQFDAHVAARAVAAVVALPKPAPAARVVAAKAAVSVAVPAPVASVVRVVLEGFGAFDVSAPIDAANLTGYVRNHIVPRVASYFEETEASVLTSGRLSADMWRATIQAGKTRAVVTFGNVPAASVNPRPLSLRKGLPSHRADALGAALGRVPDVSPSAGPARPAAARPAPSAAPAAPARMQAGTAAIFEAAARGVLPPLPDFTAETHRRYRPRLAEIAALVKAGNIAALEAAVINPVSTSPKAINRYRNAAVIALKAQAAARP